MSPGLKAALIAVNKWQGYSLSLSRCQSACRHTQRTLSCHNILASSPAGVSLAGLFPFPLSDLSWLHSISPSLCFQLPAFTLFLLIPPSLLVLLDLSCCSQSAFVLGCSQFSPSPQLSIESLWRGSSTLLVEAIATFRQPIQSRIAALLLRSVV